MLHVMYQETLIFSIIGHSFW